MAIFRLADHIARLVASAKVFMIDIPFSADQLIEACRTVVRVNGLDDGCYLRPIVYLGYGEMGLNPLPCPVNVAIAAWPWGSYLGDEGVANGVRVKVSSWQRHDPNAVPTAAKGTGMYVNSSLAKVEALKAGYDEADPAHPGRPGVGVHGREHLRRHRRAPGDAAQLGLGRPPGHHPALRGDDRQGPRARGQSYEPMIRTDLYTAAEAFLTGTAAEVVPITSVDDRLVGDGRPGAITKEIQQTYFATVRGEVDRYRDWLDVVG